MNDQTPQNSSKNNESNVQKAIFEQPSIGKSVIFKNSEEFDRKSTEERPFRCGYCEKSFTQSRAAKKHERIHTGEKPFVCRICDYKSNDSGNLRKHEKIHGIVNYLRKSPENIGTGDKLHRIYIRTVSSYCLLST